MIVIEIGQGIYIYISIDTKMHHVKIKWKICTWNQARGSHIVHIDSTQTDQFVKTEWEKRVHQYGFAAAFLHKYDVMFFIKPIGYIYRCHVLYKTLRIYIYIYIYIDR